MVDGFLIDLKKVFISNIFNLRFLGTFWLNINNCTASDLELMSKVFKIHPLTIEDMQNPEEREKCEVFEHYHYISIKMLRDDLNGVARTLSVLVFKECIITYSNDDVGKSYRSIIERLTKIKYVADKRNHIRSSTTESSGNPILIFTYLELYSRNEYILEPRLDLIPLNRRYPRLIPTLPNPARKRKR